MCLYTNLPNSILDDYKIQERGGKMKQILAVFIMAVFVLSVFSVSILAEGGNTSGDAGNQNQNQPELYDENDTDPDLVIAPINTQNKGIEARLRVCVDFLQKNRLSRTPLDICQRMLREEVSCAERLRELGVQNPAEKCGRFFVAGAQIIKERAYVAQRVTQAVNEWRLKRADGLIEKNPAAETVISALSEAKAKVFMHMTRAQQQKMVQMGKEAAVQAMDRLKLQKIEKNMLFKQREIAKDKLEKAHQNYVKAKNNFVKVNNAYNENRNLFLNAKNQLKNCEGNVSGECNATRERTREHAQNFTINAAQKAINHLEKIKSKVEGSESMDEETANGTVEELDNAIAELEAVVSEVESATTKEEIQDAAKKISQIWARIRHREQVHAARLLHVGIWNIIKRSENLEDRIDAKLAEMSEEGLDVSELGTKLDEFSSKVASAKEKYEESKELLEQADELKSDEPMEEEKEQVKELVDVAKDLIGEAHSELKEAHDLLREIVKDIKDLGADLEVEEDVEEGLAENEVYEVVEE